MTEEEEIYTVEASDLHLRVSSQQVYAEMFVEYMRNCVVVLMMKYDED